MELIVLLPTSGGGACVSSPGIGEYPRIKSKISIQAKIFGC